MTPSPRLLQQFPVLRPLEGPGSLQGHGSWFFFGSIPCFLGLPLFNVFWPRVPLLTTVGSVEVLPWGPPSVGSPLWLAGEPEVKREEAVSICTNELRGTDSLESQSAIGFCGRRGSE